MGGAPQGAMCVASQIWQVVFSSQTLQVFCLALCKKAQYVVVDKNICAKSLKENRWGKMKISPRFI
jgi:ribosomal protein S27E